MEHEEAGFLSMHNEAVNSDEDDYSPGSLVIDTDGVVDSRTPSPQYSNSNTAHQHFGNMSVFTKEPPPIIPRAPHSSQLHTLTPKTDPENDFQTSFLNDFPAAHSLTHSTPPLPHAPTPSQPSEGGDQGLPPIVTLQHRVRVCKDGAAPVDTLCVYFYLWGNIQLDILVTNAHPTYIPVKNVYQRAIPSLKQNVLSARISKHGIRSAVLPEPYVSTIKKLGLGLTGSSHYITIPDFFKICQYFKYQPPENLFHFRFVSASIATSDVLEMFNDVGSQRGRELLERLKKDKGVKEDALKVGGVSPAVKFKEEEPVPEDSQRIVDVDARTLNLPGGGSVMLIIRGDLPYIPNPELAKILPNVTRTAMEVIRNTYGIVVEHSSKTEINLMKMLGIVSPKAGRTLLYKVSDVAKMYPHWKMIIPEFIEELCAGKIPETKVDLSQPFRNSSHQRHTPRHRRKSSQSKTKTAEPVWAGQPKSEAMYGVEPVWMSRVQAGPPSHNSTTLPPSHLHPSPNTSTSLTPSHLTPDWFQQPVKLLNSIEQALMNPAEYPDINTTSTDHMTSSLSQVVSSNDHMTRPLLSAGGHVTEDFVSSNDVSAVAKRQRSSSTSGQPLHDSGLEYASLSWGEHSLTLLCPHGNQPHLPIPDFMEKVLRERPYLSPQRRSELGVVPLPATSLQTHTLRAHGCLGNFTGNVKLVSVSDAVKLAVSADVTIPGSVIHTLRAYSRFFSEPIEQLLTPRPPHPSQASQPVNSVTPYEVTVPSHPDIIDLGRGFHVAEGLLCQIKWAELKLVVYIKAPGVFYMGLYQIYEDLFKVYVTRVNFKMRMRKLHVRSIRAAPIVRVKLIELGALPPHCPVCGLILVSQVEKLAKSYGVVPPNVIYEVFLSQEVKVPPAPQSKFTRPRKVTVHRRDKATPTTSTAPSSTKEHNVFMYQFNDTPDQSIPTIGLVNRMTHTNTATSNPIGGSDTDRLVSPVYGVVPYLTSSREHLGESPNPKHLTMTSSPPVPTNQLLAPSDNVSLLVSIPRNLTHFSYAQPSSTFNSVTTTASMASKPNLGGPRRKVLQNLAKKIARKYTSSNPQISQKNFPTHKELESPSMSQGPPRVCRSCRRSNPADKKKCIYCGSGLGRSCPTCGALNPSNATSCGQCHTNLTYTWSMASGPNAPVSLPPPIASIQSVAGSSKEGVVSPSSSSPTSPKFSAPPIRSAVLKNLFPQDSRRHETLEPVAPLANTQLLSKPPFIGNLASSRKCYECGQLNSKMAKKCMGCRSHLQGRACLRCGRPNLSIVSQCHKCGAPLPSTTTPSGYKGGRSGREYKTSQQTQEEKILTSTAPISCIGCHKVRLSGYFKCGRCGDVFKTRPLVDKVPETKLMGEEEPAGEPTNQKKRKMSPDLQPKLQNDSSQFEELGRNVATLDLADALAPLLLQREEESKQLLPQAEQELEAAETEYQAFLQKKQLLQTAYDDEQAELDGLIREIEKYTSLLDNVLATEREAKETVDTVPGQISELEARLVKIEATIKLFQDNKEA